MGIESIYDALTGIGLNVAYCAFETEQEPPYAILFSEGDNPYFADGKVYYAQNEIRIEVYADKKDKVLEAAIEAVLPGGYTKDCVYIPAERLHETIYELEV